MSMIVDDLRNTGPDPLCERAADEIESLEQAYASLFKENAKLRDKLDAIFHSENQPSQYGTCTLEWHEDQRAALLAYRPEVAGLVDALTNTRFQIDEDGTNIGVSHQALVEGTGALESLAAQLAQRDEEIARLKAHAEAMDEKLKRAMPKLDPKDGLVVEIHNTRCAYRRDCRGTP